MWQERIKVEGPYDFDVGLKVLALDPLNSVDLGERQIKVPVYDPQPEAVTVRAIGTAADPEFIISGERESTREAVINRVTDIFQWNKPLGQVHDHFSKSTLKPIFDALHGSPLILDFSPYGSLIKSIIHQQLNLKFAIQLTTQFVHSFGYRKDGVWFYPQPETIAEISSDTLRSMKFSQRKAEYIIGISRLAASGELNLKKLEQLSDEEIASALIHIRGIGPWTVQNFLLFALGRPNLFPKADIGIQNALKKHFRLERKPTGEEMDKWSEEWHPYLSYASIYLWRSLDITE